MLNKYVITQTFKSKESFLFKVWGIVFHVLAGVSILINSWGMAYKIIIIILLLLSLWHCLKQDPAKKGFSIRFNSLQGWTVSWTDLDYSTINILKTSVVTPSLIIVHFERVDPSQKQQSVLIMNDAMTQDEFRRLLVMLKVSGIKKDKV